MKKILIIIFVLLITLVGCYPSCTNSSTLTIENFTNKKLEIFIDTIGVVNIEQKKFELKPLSNKIFDPQDLFCTLYTETDKLTYLFLRAYYKINKEQKMVILENQLIQPKTSYHAIFKEIKAGEIEIEFEAR